MADILIVDDQAMIRHILCGVLSSMGHTTWQACNGIQTLHLCETQRFDLLILDYRMPDMNGLEVATHLNGKMRFILHTSDFENKELKRKAQKAGALGVIAKISDIEAFSRQIEIFLSM